MRSKALKNCKLVDSECSLDTQGNYLRWATVNNQQACNY